MARSSQVPEKLRWYQFSLRSLLLGAVLLNLFFSYVGSYYQLSRRGVREGELRDMEGFFYTPVDDIMATRELTRHHRLSAFFAPANWIDVHLFGGPSPAKGGIWKLTMITSSNVRDRAVGILQQVSQHSRLEVYCAVVDLRRNPESGDERLLIPLLDYDDEMTVAATLFALTHVYGTPEAYRDLVFRFADGDPRDTGEMPIQTAAIERLKSLATNDREALNKVWELAENSAVAECPRACAGRCLSKLVDVQWRREYTEAMIWDPESQESEKIRERIRAASQGK